MQAASLVRERAAGGVAVYFPGAVALTPEGLLSASVSFFRKHTEKKRNQGRNIKLFLTQPSPPDRAGREKPKHAIAELGQAREHNRSGCYADAGSDEADRCGQRQRHAGAKQ